MGISADLAGVDPFTRALTGVDGIVIYALDPDGFITGAQVKTASSAPQASTFGSVASVSAAMGHICPTGNYRYLSGSTRMQRTFPW